MTRGWSTGASKGYVSNTMVALLCLRLPDAKSNILIDNNGHACLADFSSLTIATDQPTDTLSSAPDGTVRWMSPELFDPEKFGLTDDRPTKESDAYALGMVMYEVLSGKVPFSQCSQPAVLLKVLDGQRPSRPQGEEGKQFTDDVWGVLEFCWKHHPRDQISARTVLLRLEGQPPLQRPTFNAEEDTETGSDTVASDSGMFSPFHPIGN
jgi:serine/threonine protein kinase